MQFILNVSSHWKKITIGAHTGLWWVIYFVIAEFWTFLKLSSLPKCTVTALMVSSNFEERDIFTTFGATPGIYDEAISFSLCFFMVLNYRVTVISHRHLRSFLHVAPRKWLLGFVWQGPMALSQKTTSSLEMKRCSGTEETGPHSRGAELCLS